MDLRERVGLNVQRLRRSAGLSQEECAHRAKVHQTYLSGVERGIRNPTVTVLGKLAKALGVEVEDLVRLPTKAKGKHPNR
jgi:transcriptional regulator with XRE-family HTH domain